MIFRGPPFFANLCSCTPQCIPGCAVSSTLLRNGSVCSYTRRRNRKEQAVFVVAERIEKKGHLVKPRIEIIALERCDLNKQRIRLVASTRVVEIIVVVGYSKLCSLCQFPLIDRLVLDKRKRLNRIPGGFRCFPVEYDRPGQSLYLDRDLRGLLPCILCRCVGRGPKEEECQERCANGRKPGRIVHCQLRTN